MSPQKFGPGLSARLVADLKGFSRSQDLDLQDRQFCLLSLAQFSSAFLIVVSGCLKRTPSLPLPQVK